ncbi:MAG: nitrophenyl compound nitroreductase subunit ArsF family protein [Candidatus Gastranaerophilales bacterium]|nr:nitrophenyl compound nitroreductase subunit ArsF family protein [Candidatus Gastranaerophilales bacterium]
MFKLIRLLTILSVLIFLTLSLGFLNSSYAISENNIIPVKSEVKNNSKIIVYYFYGKPRCVSCKKIETYTKEAVASLKNNNVEFKAVDLDQPKNKHYTKDYKLYTKSVVLSKVKNEKQIKWKNLSGIWTKLNNEKEFKAYITKEIKKIGG